MAEDEKKQGWFKIGLGVMVTVYGIAAALVSFQASELDAKAREMTFVGIMELTKGNDAYAVADNQSGDDYNAVTQIILLDETGGSLTAIDIWYETRREHDLEFVVDHLALGGRLILMAGRDSCPPFPVGRFYVKDCKVFGFAMFNSPAQEQRKAAAEINRWLARGKLRPRIDRVMPLSEAAAAHRLQEENTLQGAGTLAGKIVLEV